MQIAKPCAQQCAKVVDAAQITVGGDPIGQRILPYPGRAQTRRVWQAEHGRARRGVGMMQAFVHDAQDVQLVGVAYRADDLPERFRQTRGQDMTVVQPYGNQRHAAYRRRFPGKTAFPQEDAHPPDPMIAGHGIPEGTEAAVLLKTGHIVIQGGQQGRTGFLRRKGILHDDGPGVGQNPGGMQLLQIQRGGVFPFPGAFRAHIGVKPVLMRANIRQYGVHPQHLPPAAGQGKRPRA